MIRQLPIGWVGKATGIELLRTVVEKTKTFVFALYKLISVPNTWFI